MAYCTQADVATRIGDDRLVSLADHDDDGAADTDVVQGAIGSAEALMDSFLGLRYEVPLDPVPQAATTCAVNLTVYFLQLGRDSVTEDVREQYRADLEWLRTVAAGRARLNAEESDSAAGVHYDGPERAFGREEPL